MVGGKDLRREHLDVGMVKHSRARADGLTGLANMKRSDVRAARRSLPPSAAPEFPAVLCPCCGDGLPLEVRYRVGSAATERDDVILPKTGTGTACLAGRRAGMLPLELPRHLSGSVLPG
jgi:hypothetical protein